MDWRLYRVTWTEDGGVRELRLELSGGAITGALAEPLEAELRVRLAAASADRRRLAEGFLFGVSPPAAAVAFAFSSAAADHRRVAAFVLAGTADVEQLAAFHAELSAFAAECAPLLALSEPPQTPSTAQLSAIAGRLSVWHDECVAYLPRCVTALAASGLLARTVQDALLGNAPAAAAAVGGAFAADVAKLSASLVVIPRAAAAASTAKPLIDLGDSPSPPPSTQQQQQPQPSSSSSATAELLGLADVSVSTAAEQQSRQDGGDGEDGEVDAIATEWAEWLMDATKAEPLAVRSAIDRVKTAASKELNAARKLLAHGMTNHHALYHAVVSLHESPARRIVHGLLRAEEALVGSDHQNTLGIVLRLHSLLAQQPAIPHSHLSLY